MKDQNVHKDHRKRMRDRFIKTDGVGFADHELLELLLFHSIPRRDTNALAHNLLERFGDIQSVFEAKVPELEKVDGIGNTSAVLLNTVFHIHKAILEAVPSHKRFLSQTDIGEYLVSLFKHYKVETVVFIVFDKQGRMIRKEHVAMGTGDYASIDIKKIITTAIDDAAYSAVLAHNHLSGQLKPSASDIVVTKNIYEMLESLNIELLDHFIVSGDEYLGIMNDKYSKLYK